MPKTNSNTHRVSTAIGASILCAALVITPIATNLLTTNGATHAAGLLSRCTEMMPESWNSVQISKDNYIDAINSAEKITGVKEYDAIFAAGEKATNTQSDIIATLQSEAKAAGYGGSVYSISDIATIKASANYSSNTALQAAVNKAETALTAAIDEYKSIVTANEPSLNLDGFSDFSSDIAELVNKPLSEKYGDKFAYYINLGFLSGLANDSYNMNDAELRKDDFYELTCSAKKLNPNFTVQYVLSTDPFGDTTEGNKPSTGDNTGNADGDGANTPSNVVLENNDVRVSGSSIKNNYTLAVDKVTSDLLKLTGDDFKNSLNQAFYDIFIHDDKGSRIENTGKVSVSIKLPSNMSAKSDFIVYYVPTAANGEYLTDQAKAITGVKVSADGWITFETDHFSVYGIVEYPKGKAPNTGVVAKSEGSATAGGVKIAAGIVSVLTAVGTGIVASRQMLRKENKQA